MDLLNDFKNFVEKETLFLPSEKILLAVSGGADSIVLCELLHLVGFQFEIAHCNFQLRGDESVRDEKFVLALEKKYGTNVWMKRFETSLYAQEKKVSIQVAARELRYDWFHFILKERPDLKYIATAHHQDDNVETIVMNFFKGAGLAGLRGMLPKSGKLLRPLLFAKKSELLEFAQLKNLDFVEDSTNQGEKYTRNFFRLQVLPLIEKHYPQAFENIVDNSERFRDIEILFSEALSKLKGKLLEKRGDEFHIPVEKLRKVKGLRSLIHSISKEFGFTVAQEKEILQLMDSDTGKYIQSGSHRILKNRNWLIVSAIAQSNETIVVIDSLSAPVSFPGGELKFELGNKSSSFKLPTQSSIACLEAKEIKLPLILRKWKRGDYFYPLGMRRKKKLARFFIDEKLSMNEKENIWVLEMDKKILWVVGKRIDDRFKLSESSEQIFMAELKSV